MKNLILFSLFAFTANQYGLSQCGAGESAVTFVMHTDAWAYENYWQVNLTGTGCNASPIAEGANLNVGCGAIESDNSPNGYSNNATYTEGPFCLTVGTSYELIFVDSYGDGGLVIEVLEDGALTHVYTGSGSGNTWNFTIGQSNIPTYDQPCTAQEIIADGPSFTFNNTNAIAAYGELAPAGVDCQAFGFWCEGSSTNSVWASFVPTTNSTSFEVTTCNPGTNTDTQIAVWRVSDCSDFSSYELIATNDDMIGGCSAGDNYASTTFTSCLEIGQLYLIQIDGWEGAVGDIELSVHTYQSSNEILALVNSVTCPLEKGDVADGSIYPYIVGAGINFTASWTSNNGFTSSDLNIENIEPGMYTLTATTACGTILNSEYTINIPEPWLISTSVTNPNCGFSDGQILVNVTGATPPYEFNWTSASGTPLSNANPITDLGIGGYNMVITDDQGCTFDYNFNITDCVSISELDASQSVALYPNPSNGKFKLELSLNTTAIASIYNLTGKEVHTQIILPLQQNTYFDTELGNGIYLMVIRINEEETMSLPFEIRR
ncbi:MAG: T9SS type A sorting domain-containing protein [Bacteroidota bacterium]